MHHFYFSPTMPVSSSYRASLSASFACRCRLFLNSLPPSFLLACLLAIIIAGFSIFLHPGSLSACVLAFNSLSYFFVQIPLHTCLLSCLLDSFMPPFLPAFVYDAASLCNCLQFYFYFMLLFFYSFWLSVSFLLAYLSLSLLPFLSFLMLFLSLFLFPCPTP